MTAEQRSPRRDRLLKPGEKAEGFAPPGTCGAVDLEFFADPKVWRCDQWPPAAVGRVLAMAAGEEAAVDECQR